MNKLQEEQLKLKKLKLDIQKTELDIDKLKLDIKKTESDINKNDLEIIKFVYQHICSSLDNNRYWSNSVNSKSYLGIF